MSENEVDTTENEVIESEIVESEVAPQELEQPTKTVVIKKGSFFAILAFLLSLAAIALSGYMYYLQYLKKTQVIETQTWQVSLSEVDDKISQQNTDLSQQIQTINSNNQVLMTQLKALDTKLKTVQLNKPEQNANKVISQKFDDSAIKQQIAGLESNLNQQTNRISELQNKLTANEQSQNQSLQQFKQVLKAQQSTGQNIVKNENNYIYDKAESLLQAAHIQLNINANVVKAQELLKKTYQQLVKLSGAKFSTLAEELQSITTVLSTQQNTDVNQLMQQVEKLAASTAGLKFSANNTQAEQQANKEPSWYEKLIVIRKIDQQQKATLNISEQQAILNSLKADYQMLYIALNNQDQTLWQTKIDQIKNVLDKHFVDQGQKQQLEKLKIKNIKPNYPDLEPYLIKLKSYQVTVSSGSD